jgi:hypothetical protein
MINWFLTRLFRLASGVRSQAEGRLVIDATENIDLAYEHPD